MGYTLKSGYSAVGEDITKSDIVASEGLGTTVLQTRWLVALVAIPALAAIWFGMKLRKAGLPLLKA